MPINQPPWIAWANRTVVTIPTAQNAEGHEVIPQTFQLSQASVGRPITWSFLFVARILQADPTANSTVQVDFNVSTGIGQAKSSVSAGPFIDNLQPGFCHFVFDGTPLDPRAANALKWTSAVPSPQLDDLATASDSVTLDRLVAERVECNASIIYTTGMEAFVPVVIELFAGFAPYNMRDEWFADLETFG
jgi:hypothetical protein